MRPAVEAGERLGFLPGDLTQKVDPYLRPMYDALYEMLGFDRVARYIERNIIEGTGDRLSMVRGVTELNNEFHRGIQQASRNRRLQQVLRTVIDIPLVFRSFYWYTDSELTEAAHEHELIIGALSQGDGERSEQLMRQHVARGLNTLRREISGSATRP